MHNAKYDTASPTSLRPRTGHLTIPPSLPRRIIRLQDPRLRLISLREGVTALFAHALHLPDFTNGFLELFHAVVSS